MAEFASFGDVDEVKRYQKRAQALTSKLDAAVDKIEEFNTEEDLFEWERVKYPQRKQLSDTLSHYSKLYDRIVDFQDKHEWVHTDIAVLWTVDSTVLSLL